MSSMTQSDHVFDELRADILACRLMPGSKIRINELSAQLDVSLGAVREALSRLSADGLVVSEPQKGFTVSPVSKADLIDLTKTRVAIEGLCLADALENGDIDWESRIVAAFHRLRRIPERTTEEPNRLNIAWSNAHAEFHEALVAGCRSEWLRRIRAMLYARSERYRHLSVPLNKSDRNVEEEHREITEAVLKRDAESSKRLIGAHFARTTAILLESLPANPAEADFETLLRRRPSTRRLNVEHKEAPL